MQPEPTISQATPVSLPAANPDGPPAVEVRLAERLRLLPEQPGVYLMKDRRSRVLYVGKARSLRSRVRSYFQATANLLPRTQAMVAQVVDLDYIVTDSEVEALVLECNLIKFHRPKYNVRLNDDKTLPYLKLTLAEEYPRLLLSRRIVADGARYFGPYTDGTALAQTRRLLEAVFPLRTCKESKLRRRERPCLNAHIGRCLGPCGGGVDGGEYAALVEQVGLFLEGRGEALLAEFNQRMAAAAADLDFERAARLRDQVRALQTMVEKQKMVSTREVDQDVLGVAQGWERAVVQVFFVRAGKLVGRESYWLQGAGESSPEELLAAFLAQYYARVEGIPPRILLPLELPPGERELLQNWLRERRRGAVALAVPRRGEKRELVELAGKNARLALEERLQQQGGEEERGQRALARLQQELRLAELPERIEGYDISNFQGADAVGSMVVFQDGAAAVRDYRQFRIKRVDGPDDYASLAEVLKRRFERALRGSPGFEQLPDLVLIDGGKGQLGAAVQVLAELGLELPVVSLAKQQEQVFVRGEVEPRSWPAHSAALQLLQQVRDEAHRFALTAHRRRRRQSTLHSRLEDVPGVGPKRRRSLLRHFGSLARIRQAEVEELAAAPGMNRTVAQAVWEFLREEE